MSAARRSPLDPPVGLLATPLETALESALEAVRMPPAGAALAGWRGGPPRADRPVRAPRPAPAAESGPPRAAGDRPARAHSTVPPAPPPADAEALIAPLWRRAQAGDDAAYREALQAIARRLRGYLRRRLVGQPDEVEDLLQETLLALHLQRGSFDPAVPVTAWVLAIARHKLVDHWRRHGRQGAQHQRLDEVDELALGHVDGQPGEARRDLGRLLQALPDAQRRAIELTKLGGWSVAEAAQQAGVSETALKVQVHRGLKRLAAWVRGGAPGEPTAPRPRGAADGPDPAAAGGKRGGRWA